MTATSHNGHLLPGPRYKDKMNTEALVVLSDVDNTILPNESLDVSSPRVTQAFHVAGEKVPTGLATARQPQKFEYLARHLKLSGKSILSNGAQIFDGKKGIMIVERILQIDTVMNIARELQAMNIDHWIQDGGIDYRWVPQKTTARKARSTSEGLGLYRCPQDILDIKKGLKDVPAYLPGKPFIIVSHKVNAVVAAHIQEMVKGYKDESITAFIAHEFKDAPGVTFEVFIADKRANKLAALQEIQHMEKIALDAFLAIGDGHNDRVLIENVGLGVAMGNAVESVKQVATFIAPDQAHDGAAVAIEELVLKPYS